jgi:hypothetical protein
MPLTIRQACFRNRGQALFCMLARSLVAGRGLEISATFNLFDLDKDDAHG